MSPTRCGLPMCRSLLSAAISEPQGENSIDLLRLAEGNLGSTRPHVTGSIVVPVSANVVPAHVTGGTDVILQNLGACVNAPDFRT